MKLVVGTFVKRRRRILFIKRRSGLWPGFWTLPGGKVEPGESPEEAARRELFEEVGIVAPLLIPVNVEHYFDPHGVECNAIMFYDYLSTDTPTNKEPDKHRMIHWFEQSGPPRQMIPPVHSFIRDHPRIVLGQVDEVRKLLTLLKRHDTPSVYRPAQSKKVSGMLELPED